eukprot:Gb_11733 [translate_table: standard]
MGIAETATKHQAGDVPFLLSAWYRALATKGSSATNLFKHLQLNGVGVPPKIRNPSRGTCKLAGINTNNGHPLDDNNMPEQDDQKKRIAKLAMLRLWKWGDVVEIDTWVAASGKNGMRRDWLVRDYKSGQILTRATSTWVMMNKETRKLSKFPKEVREEIEPYYLERSAIVGDDAQKIYKLDDDTAENIRSGLSPRWSDMDVNQHVNNVKYIGWILESVPIPILRNHDLANMIIEFRRECRPSYMLQSLTSLKCNDASIDSRSTTPFSYTSGFSDKSKSLCALRYTHLLRLQEDGSEIVRGRTEWRPKEMKNFHNLH